MKNVVIVQQSGRLGNQLHMYAATQEIYKGCTIIYIGFKDLNNICDNLRGTHINFENKTFMKKIKKYVGKFADKKMISQAIEIPKNTPPIHDITGFFSNIIYLRECYFQNNWSTEKINELPILKNSHEENAKYWIAQNTPQDANTIFLHIRRGDYLSWPSEQHPAVLHLEWYKNAMKEIEAHVPNAHFIVMGDDKKYMNDNFHHLKNASISNCDEFIDLCIMKNCEHGILSASTFSWWGAFLNHHANKNNKKIFIAPKYWAGHAKKTWYPCNFISDWLRYI